MIIVLYTVSFTYENYYMSKNYKKAIKKIIFLPNEIEYITKGIETPLNTSSLAISFYCEQDTTYSEFPLLQLSYG